MESGKNRFIDITENDEDYNDCDASTQVCDSKYEKCITVAEITSTACTKNTESKCNGEKLTKCVNVGDSKNESYKLVNIDCPKLDASCATATDVAASCIPKKSACKEGETETVCDESFYVPAQYTVTCTKFTNNTWHPVITSDFGFCNNACNEAGTACDAQGVEDGMEE